MKNYLTPKNLVYLCHLLPMIILTGLTLPHLPENTTLSYLLFTLVFAVNTLFALYQIVERQRASFFAYLFSLLLQLGFWFKYSIHTILKTPYIEPIGSYTLWTSEDGKLLFVASMGALGILFAQLLFMRFFYREPTHDSTPEKRNKKNYLIFFLFLVLACIMAILNHKYNILLFGLKPDVTLPFKGNVIFFLTLTRFLLFFTFVYISRSLSFSSIFMGAIIASIASIGVMSRMTILTFFVTLLVYFLYQMKDFNWSTFSKRALSFVTCFIVFSAISVHFSTGLRDIQYTLHSAQAKATQNNNEQSPQPAVEHLQSFKSDVQLKQSMAMYAQLAVDRWIGIEGLMAVYSYADKGWNLFKDALCEKSYHGKSFYMKIAAPDYYANINGSSTISTSVPGPIGFFYLVGSSMVLVACILGFSFALMLAEHCIMYFGRGETLGTAFVAVFLVFDSYQFGIAPLAFLKYLSFSLVVVIAFFKQNTFFNLKKSIIDRKHPFS